MDLTNYQIGVIDGQLVQPQGTCPQTKVLYEFKHWLLVDIASMLAPRFIVMYYISKYGMYRSEFCGHSVSCHCLRVYNYMEPSNYENGK